MTTNSQAKLSQDEVRRIEDWLIRRGEEREKTGRAEEWVRDVQVITEEEMPVYLFSELAKYIPGLASQKAAPDLSAAEQSQPQKPVSTRAVDTATGIKTQVVADSYLAECDYKNLALRTRQYYRSIVNRLVKDFSLFPTSRHELESYLSQFAPRNRQNHYNILLAFFKFAEREYHLPNPLANVQRPRVKDKPQPTIWPEQAEEIEAKLEGDMERKLWVLGYGMGWRRSELYRLRKKDIKDSEIEVHGKEREEMVGLLPEIREVLLANTEDLGPDDSIFRGQRGPLSDNGIWRMAKGMLARGGLQASTHTLRHGYGTALALQGCDAHTIMRLMRHKSIDEAIRYIHMAEPHLTDRQRKYSPLDMVKRTRTQKALM